MKKHTSIWLWMSTIPVIILGAIPLSGCAIGGATPRGHSGEAQADRTPLRVHDLSFTLRGVQPGQHRTCDSPVTESAVPYDRIKTGCPAGTEYFASRAEGERQLQELARTVVPEDAWVYFESYSLWIDVGENPDADSVVTNFDPVVEVLASGPIPPTELHMYILHPVHETGSDDIAPPRVAEICAHATLEHTLRLQFDMGAALHVVDQGGMWTCRTARGHSEWTMAPNIGGRPILRGPKGGAVSSHAAIEPVCEMEAPRMSVLVRSVAAITHDSSIEREQRIAACLEAARKAGVTEVYTPW